jgi:hypothetical protein
MTTFLTVRTVCLRVIRGHTALCCSQCAVSYVRVICSLIFWLHAAQVTSLADTFLVCSSFSSTSRLVNAVVFDPRGFEASAFCFEVATSLSVVYPSSESSSTKTRFVLTNMILISAGSTVLSLTDWLDVLTSSRLFSVYLRFALLLLVLAICYLILRDDMDLALLDATALLLL